MNYLAHLYLAGATAASRIGNLLGDFVKGTTESLTDHYPPEVIDGIMMHRHLDRFTDQHEPFLQAREFLAKERRRVAGVVIDVFSDHFLTIHWNQYFDHPLPAFIEEIYDTLESHRDWLSPDLARVLPLMRSENWLRRYGTLEGQALTFERISERSPRLAPIRRSTDDLVAHYQSLDHSFRQFFAAARAQAKLLLAR
ncbi:MAG: ACP phosphodiesterase [Akkermansiaceae bacterium]